MFGRLDRPQAGGAVRARVADRDGCIAEVEKERRKYRAIEDDDLAARALGFVQEADDALAAAETRVEVTRDALASVPVEAPRDRLLDFAIDLRAAVAGNAEKAHSVGT